MHFLGFAFSAASASPLAPEDLVAAKSACVALDLQECSVVEAPLEHASEIDSRTQRFGSTYLIAAEPLRLPQGRCRRIALEHLGTRTVVRETHFTNAAGDCVEATELLQSVITPLRDDPNTWQALLKHACNSSLQAVGGACDIRMFELDGQFEWNGGTLEELVVAMDTAGRTEGQRPLEWRVR